MDKDQFVSAVVNNGLHVMTPNDVDAFATCAASGYVDYPLFIHLFGRTDDAQSLARTFWRAVLGSLGPNAVCYAVNSACDGFAIWLPATYRGTNPVAFLASGGLKLPFLAGPGILTRLMRYERHAQQTRLSLGGAEGWYFYNLVVRAGKQGQGIATRLVAPALELMDSHGQTVYLETHRAKNVSLYEHYGFELLAVSDLPKDPQVQHHAMMRRPRQA